MKISVLETNMLTNGDLSLSQLESLGDVDFYNKLADSEIIRLCADSDIILCTKTVFHKELINSLPCLKLICVFATGYNNIDVAHAREKGIAVANAPAYSTQSVVQHVFSLILNLAGNTYKYIESTMCGDWIQSPTFSYFNIPITEIAGKTIGIVGYGAIGKGVAKVAEAFGMKVLVSSRTPKADCPYPQIDIDELLPLCDFLSLNCPLNEGTYRLINAQRLSRMKPTAYIINTARGPCVDERAVSEALYSGTIAGYGADVIEIEPMRPDSALYGAPNCILTPHIAWASIEARTRLMEISVNNIKGFIDGTPVNLVN
ncbi:MAG: D-2-hydroxyacid dehydrogenase [Ruminococcaceae bacterium]|nr:D-2-hydroxyacid dehydrogenase [Oscillospiraceae bacterium]